MIAAWLVSVMVIGVLAIAHAVRMRCALEAEERNADMYYRRLHGGAVMNFADYQQTLTDTAKNYDDADPKAIDGSPIPSYAALGLAGETGEVVELVKKAIRSRVPLDRAKLALELGDVLWYITRLGSNMGLPLELIAQLSDMKLRRRNEKGKDEAAELDAARAHLRGGLK